LETLSNDSNYHDSRCLDVDVAGSTREESLRNVMPPIVEVMSDGRHGFVDIIDMLEHSFLGYTSFCKLWILFIVMVLPLYCLLMQQMKWHVVLNACLTLPRTIYTHNTSFVYSLLKEHHDINFGFPSSNADDEVGPLFIKEVAS
jgi:hypothetical protein